MGKAQDHKVAPAFSKKLHRCCVLAGQIVVLATVLSSAETPAAPAVTLAIIANPGVPATALGSGEVASIFTRAKRTWKDGTTIRPLNMQIGSPERVEFDRVVLDMGADASAKYWIDKQVRGEEGAPKAVAQANIVVSLVASMSGAVGYVPEDRVDAKVRVIARIRDGKLVAP
jgi:hypothetical protein